MHLGKIWEVVGGFGGGTMMLQFMMVSGVFSSEMFSILCRLSRNPWSFQGASLPRNQCLTSIAGQPPDVLLGSYGGGSRRGQLGGSWQTHGWLLRVRHGGALVVVGSLWGGIKRQYFVIVCFE